jgi:hypothetical protein
LERHPSLRTGQAGFHHALLQKPLDQIQHGSIADALGHRRQQLVLGNVVEVAFDVGVHDPDVSGVQKVLDASERIFCPPSRSEPVAVFGKGVLENRFDHLAQGRLDHSIFHRRYPQRSQFFAPQLRYPDPAHRSRLVFPAAK